MVPSKSESFAELPGTKLGQNDLVACVRGFQIGDNLGVLCKIVGEFGFDRQLHSGSRSSDWN